MKLTSLDTRLKTAASFVSQNSVCADIGTDHAYLPCRLILDNVSKFCVACDINPEPLESAKKTVGKFGLEDKIKLILCDGMSGFDNNDISSVTDIVIAGMGGELIAKIIDDAKWCKNERYNFILQPMTKAEFLREYLCKNGFIIKDEAACIAKNKRYTVINAAYTNKTIAYDNLFLYIGMLKNKTDFAAMEYKQMIYNKIVKTAKGITKSGHDLDKAAELIDTANMIFHGDDI